MGRDGPFSAETASSAARMCRLRRSRRRVGTPVYVYSTATMCRHVAALRSALAPLPDPLIAYAVKANPNSAVIATLAESRPRRGRGLGRRISARDRGWRAGRKDRLFRRRQNRRRNAPRAGRRSLPIQPGIARRGGDAFGGRGCDGPHRAGRLSGQSGRAGWRTREDHDRRRRRTSSGSRSAKRSKLMLAPPNFRAFRFRESRSTSAAS